MLLGKWILVFHKIVIVLKYLNLMLKDSDGLKLCELLGQQRIMSNKTCIFKFTLLCAVQWDTGVNMLCVL